MTERGRRPFCHARRSLSVLPAVSSSVLPAAPLLSFPPVFSGNPSSPGKEKTLDARLKPSGMTERGRRPSCPPPLLPCPPIPFCPSCRLLFCPSRRPPSVLPAVPLLSFPPVFSGNPSSPGKEKTLDARLCLSPTFVIGEPSGRTEFLCVVTHWRVVWNDHRMMYNERGA